MALKTQPTGASVSAFLDGIEDEQRRADCRAVAKLMAKASGAKPKMWGTSIVGFGERHYTYATGREGDWFPLGFSPRKNDITLYLSDGAARHKALLAKLGRHSTGVSCLYIKRLADVDIDVLEKIIAAALVPAAKP